MAMVKCPEGGQEISDKATACPHCGVKIFVCPECGHINLGNGACASCGYVLPEEKAKIAPDSNQAESKKNLFDRWNESVPEEKTKKIIFDILSGILIIIPLIYGVVWYFQSFDNYLNVTPESYLRLIVSHSSDVNRLNTVFYMIVIMVVILPAIIDVMDDFFSDYNFAKWIRSNHIDISREINSTLSRSGAKKKKKGDNEEFSFNEIIREAKEEESSERIDSACFMATNPNKAYLLAVIQFVSKIAWCVLQIFVWCWAQDMVMSFMRSVMNGTFETDINGVTTFTRNFQMEWWPFLLWAGIVLVIAIAVQIVSSRVREKVIIGTLKKVQNIS